MSATIIACSVSDVVDDPKPLDRVAIYDRLAKQMLYVEVETVLTSSDGWPLVSFVIHNGNGTTSAPLMKTLESWRDLMGMRTIDLLEATRISRNVPEEKTK